jgi:iron complex outermembrane receptor protein
VINSTDLIRQKWLDNDFYGTTLSLKYTKANFNLISGGAFSIYNGDHYGKVIWARYASDSEKNHQYYFNNGLKKDFNIFSKMQYTLTEKWNVFLDLQLRNVNYKTQDFLSPDIDKNWMFFNPKAGLTYQLNAGNQIYTSYARASREPLREDFEYAFTEPKPEKLDNFELGWRYIKNNNLLQINAYAMLYKDQLVLTGGLTDSGSYIRANSGKSYRIGVELESQIAFSNKLKWLPNLAISNNQNIDFYFENSSTYKHPNISFSPGIIAGSQLSFELNSNIKLALLNKYVGSQYLDNYQSSDSKLDAYFVSDIQAQWNKSNLLGMKEIKVSALLNNIFNQKYASNGYMYEATSYYFPQAGINFLAGVDLTF